MLIQFFEDVIDCYVYMKLFQNLRNKPESDVSACTCILQSNCILPVKQLKHPFTSFEAYCCY